MCKLPEIHYFTYFVCFSCFVCVQFAEKMKTDTKTPSPGGKIPAAWKSTPTAMSPPQRTFSTFGKADDTGTIGPSLPQQTPISLQKPAYLTFGQSTESIGPSRPMQGPSMPPVSIGLIVSTRVCVTAQNAQKMKMLGSIAIF